jgi:hypothetical protein
MAIGGQGAHAIHQMLVAHHILNPVLESALLFTHHQIYIDAHPLRRMMLMRMHADGTG